jgi:hypothetical protein
MTSSTPFRVFGRVRDTPESAGSPGLERESFIAGVLLESIGLMKFVSVWLQNLSNNGSGAPRPSFSSLKPPSRAVEDFSAPRPSRFDQQTKRAEKVPGSRKRFLDLCLTYSSCILSLPHVKRVIR